MPRPRTSRLTKKRADSRFRELVDELKLLTVAFPHLREAVDPEDLPVPFLLKRGADRAAAKSRKADGSATRSRAKLTATKATEK